MVVPVDTPYIIPAILSTVAIEVFALVHVPPDVALLKAVVALIHTFVVPLIGFTVPTITGVVI